MVVSCQLSVVGCQLPVVGFQLRADYHRKIGPKEYPKVIVKRVQFLAIKVIKHIEGMYHPTKNKNRKTMTASSTKTETKRKLCLPLLPLLSLR
jgi:hypothetical protein